jgi:hypothetical protein
VVCKSQIDITPIETIRGALAILPWKDGPRHLVSWWDMEKFEAGKYLNVAGNLAATAQVLANIESGQIPLSPQNLQNIRGQFLERAKECRELGLIISGRQFEIAAENLADVPARAQVLSIQVSTMIIDLQNAMAGYSDEGGQ